MEKNQQGASTGVDRLQAKMLGILRETVPGQGWVSSRQHKIWRPPTDVYETDDYVVVKVEIAGMEGQDFEISLESKRLVIGGFRRDPAEKLAYQQMEIPYGQFETDVYLAWSIDQDQIEATYQNGFLTVSLPRAKARQVPVVGADSSS